METPATASPLIILGFGPSTIPIILETAYAAWGITTAQVYENIPRATDVVDYLPPGFTLDIAPWAQQPLPAHARIHLGVSGGWPKAAVTAFFATHAGIQPAQHATLVHPQAVVMPSATLGAGSFIEPGTVISSFARLGWGVSVKRGATVGHHSRLGRYVNINPGATICGRVSIGAGTIVGAGAVVSDGVSIGHNCLIGAGSVVVRDIPDRVVAYGNPCKVARTRTEAHAVEPDW